MILLYAKKLSEEFLFRWMEKLAFVLAGAALFYVGWIFVEHALCVWRDQERQAEGDQPSLHRSFPGELIGQGPLRLRPIHTSRWIAKVAEEVILLAYNSRPDQNARDAQVILQLKEGKKQLAVANGNLVYLQEQEGGNLIPSPEISSLWIRPIVLDETSSLIEVGRELPDGRSEKGEFITSFQGVANGGKVALQESVAIWQSAVAFSLDLVLQKYGGSEFASWNRAIAVDFTHETKNYGLRLFAGDHLMYDEGEWRVVGIDELKTDRPVAHVVACSDKGLDVQIWDEKGFSPVRVKIPVKQPTKGAFGVEVTSARFRTSSQVSCLFGKRRILLKQGDWLIRGISGWRHLRSLDELHYYLERRVRGELFVCDAIEKDQTGKGVIKGTLFDETRTSMQPLSIPVHSEKSQQKTSRKRRASSAHRGNV